MGRQVRERTKPCERCDRPADVLYRVRIVAGGDWIFLCRPCWDAVPTDTPEYRYGGTWKARKRG